MARLSCAALFALVLLAGCTRRAPTGDDYTYCGQLSLGSCAKDPRCDVQNLCCGSGQRCVPQGAAFVPCPSCTSACASLDEAHCKANPSCRADYCDRCQCTPSFVSCTLATSTPPVCEALPCAPLPMPCSCHGLDEAQCQAAAPTLGCTAQTCPDCHGGQTFVGCAGPNEGQGACPAGCPGGCRTNQDCSGGTSCFPPSSAPLSCTNSTDCGDGEVCSGGQCVAKPCTLPGDCPKLFECVVPPHAASPACQRRACGSDGDCPGGYCVDGACYPSLGFCAVS